MYENEVVRKIKERVVNVGEEMSINNALRILNTIVCTTPLLEGYKKGLQKLAH